MRCCPVPAGRAVPSAWLLGVFVGVLRGRALHAKVTPRGAEASPPAHVLTPRLLVPTSHSLPAGHPAPSTSPRGLVLGHRRSVTGWSSTVLFKAAMSAAGAEQCPRPSRTRVPGRPAAGQARLPLLPAGGKSAPHGGGTDKPRCGSRGRRVGPGSGHSQPPRPRSAVVSA